MSAASASARLQVGGTLVPDRDLYIARPEDEELFELLREREYVNIVSSRQVGKSSAMVRAALRLQAEGWRFAVVDLTSLGTPPDADGYFQGLIKGLVAGLKLKLDVPAFWAAHAGDTASQRLIAFLRDVVLTEIAGPVAIFLDEIDSTLKLSYTDDLFTALRAIYNERTFVEGWRRLVFCLVGVATPNELIKDRRTTPYNVGRTVWVGDFDPARDDLGTLARALHADPAKAQPLLARVLYWTGGHPFLTLRLVKEAREAGASDPAAVDALVEQSFANLKRLGEDVHIQSILRFVTERLTDGGATLALYERILGDAVEIDQPALTHAELKLSGLVRREPSGRLAVRNLIYGRLFDRAWVGASKPVRSARRYRGAAIAAGLALLLTVSGGTAYYRYTVRPELAELKTAFTKAETALAAREELQRLNINLGEDAQGRLTVSFPARAPQRVLAEAVPPLDVLRTERGTPRALVVDLAGTEINDLAPLDSLAGIEKLDLSGTKVKELATLPVLSNLLELDVSGTQVHDVEPLTRLQALETLDLSWTKVSRVEPLATLRRLRRLVLGATVVKDLSPLYSLPNLVEIDLSGRECGQCPEMVVVPDGSFEMGSPAGEAYRYVNEGPQRNVYTPAFAIGRYEVTFAEWDACAAAGGCKIYRPNDEGWGRGRQPVVNVSWQDAEAFAAWLGIETGQPYRLPTEAEWEYAARAATTTTFWTGTTISTAQANYDGRFTYGHGIGGVYRRQTMAVDDAAIPANRFGLYHILGNVWEWVGDCYSQSYKGALEGVQKAVERSDCSERVVRGGSWDDGPWDLRSANRIGLEPDKRDSLTGFRVARALNP